MRVTKDDPRVAAYGTVDEANAVIGLACTHLSGREKESLARIQNDLFDVGADLCAPVETSENISRLRVAPAQTEWLEAEIDRMNVELAPLESFVLPAGSAAAAHLHFARTVVRRAERDVVALMRSDNARTNAEVLRYLNRLSDYLFVLARFVNHRGKDDVLWTPGGSHQKKT